MYSTSLFALLPFIRVILLSSIFVSADVSTYHNSQEYQEGTYGNYTSQTYITEPGLIAPVANILVAPQDGVVSASEYILWTPVGFEPGENGHGPYMLNATDLSLVYAAPEYHERKVAPWGQESIGATVQTCNNTDYITWWGGKGFWGYKAGRYYMLDTNYNLAFNVSAVGHEFADAHEFFLTPQCTAVFTSYYHTSHNLSIFNITDGWIIDNSFQEVDIATGELLFEWRASEHIDLTDTYLTPNMSKQGRDAWNGMDFFHMNSIEKDAQGNYLISSRHTRSLYYINGQTGAIEWTLGGKRNDFTDLSNGTATNFSWQHHARWTSAEQTSISLFDNHNAAIVFDPNVTSRGIILEISVEDRTVALATEYFAPDHITAIREGSMQLQDNANVLLGWGNEPGWTEYSANGTIVWDVRFGPLSIDRFSADNYRALKVNWTGTPTWSPKIAAGPADASLLLPLTQSFVEDSSLDSNNTAYFSWNGATDVDKWIILASDDETSPLDSTADMWQEVSKTGFESSIFVNGSARYVRAVAVARNESVLAATPILDMQTGNVTEAVFDVVAFEEDLTALTQTWGEAAFNLVQDKWEKARASKQFKPAAVSAGGAFVVVLVIGAIAIFMRRRGGMRGGYGRIVGRKRSDTMDSKLESSFSITVVDYDEENSFSGGEYSPTFMREGDKYGYSDDENDRPRK